MTKKNKIVIGAAILAIVLIIAGVIGYRNYKEYHETYLVIDDVEYLRASETLDLSGKPVVELGKLAELQQTLKQLDLRDTGITTQNYDDLRVILPDCEILWSVPFQGGFVDSTSTVLTIEALSEDDFAAFAYLPALEKVNAAGCRDYDALNALAELYPDLSIAYTVTICGDEHYNDTDSLTLTDPDAGELMENLKLLPAVTSVKLKGTLPENTELLKLKEAYPAITFDWTFDLLGVSVNTLDEFVDLSGIKMEDTTALEAALPCFYNLTQVDMVGCGISNKEMDALNKRYPDTKIVWAVSVGGVSVRTDAKYFMPVKYKMQGFGSYSAYNLRYCTEMEALDFGHYGSISSLTFLEYMPNLKYLLLCETSVSDLTSIGTCKNLVFLELFLTEVKDYWPLTNLTNLEDLNLSYTPHLGETKVGGAGDITPLLQMTWLDRLWLASVNLSSSQRQLLRESLPGTTLLFYSDGSTNRGWRQAPNYYKQRDVVEMWYMVH